MASFRWLRLAVLGVCCLAATSVASAAAKQPNLLIIYADDLGWGETGVQGCKDIPTPHIDSLANNGIRFPQGYVAATYCSPSRAGLMTGRYPTRFGHEFNAVARHSGLSLKETTIANRLKSLGYATCCVGKWHLGGDASTDYLPVKRGFDEFFGTVNNTSFYHPQRFIDSRKSLEVEEIDDDTFYTTDEYADRSVDWLEQHKDAPWFLYLPFNAQHAPLQAPQKYLDRFPDLEGKRKIFAAMMVGMDDAVGRVLETIRKHGQEENTIIFFVGDNGGPTASTTSHNGALRGFKMTTFEGGPRVPFFVQWKGTLAAGKTYDHPVLNLDILPTCVVAAGGKIDPSWNLDGLDLMPYLTGQNTAKPHETIYWRYGEQWAIRHGDWKLVVSKGGSGKPELYNLANDVSESRDMASAESGKVAELQKMWDAWSAEQAEPTARDDKQAAAKKKGDDNAKGGKKKAKRKNKNK